MGKAYGGKYNNNKGAPKRGQDAIPQSSLEDMVLVVRISKDITGTGAEGHFAFNLEKLDINVDKAKVSALYDLHKRAYEGNDIVQTCFTTVEDEDDSDEEDDEDEDEEDEDEDEDDEVAAEAAVKAKDGEALDDWVEVAKEADAIGKKPEDENKPAEDEGDDNDEEEDDEEDDDEEEEDENPYKLVFRNKKGKFMDIDRNVPIIDLFDDGDVVITTK
ncbi:hypothetical protein H4218_003158 [Coemansia sp. IMI 209128]|nr:hypothetical protein GGI10_005363 [Coemansia sp. RSA 2530]KAJ2698626.1 hypothetical protein H4218_003158 [Coemansia sp. IMI 209128]